VDERRAAIEQRGIITAGFEFSEGKHHGRGNWNGKREWRKLITNNSRCQQRGLTKDRLNAWAVHVG
jgi:hypothetical protein